MYRLIKSDFYRVRKDLILKIIFIIIILASSLTSLLLKFIISDSVDASTLYNGKSLLLNSINPLQNVGFLLPILLGIIFAREYSNGTIRNKIIAGYSRTQIYMSSYVVIMFTGLILVFLSMVLNLITGTMAFGYGADINSAEMKNILIFIVLGLLVYSFFITMSFLFIHIFEKFSFIGYMVSVFIVAGLYAVTTTLSNLYNTGLYEILNKINPMTQIDILVDMDYTKNNILFVVISSIIFFVFFKWTWNRILE